MAVDKLVDSTQLDTDLTSVANAIRTKGGTSAQLAFPAGFVSAVEAIPTGGGGGIFPSEMFTVIPASDTNTITVQSALTRVDSVILFILGDNTSYDTSKRILRTKFQIANTKLRVSSNNFSTGNEWYWLVDGSADYWNTATALALSGGNLTIRCNFGQFQSGATYTVYIVDLEAL